MCRKKKKYIEPSSSDESSSSSSDSDAKWIEHKAVVKKRRHGHSSDHHVSKCKKAQIVKVESDWRIAVQIQKVKEMVSHPHPHLIVIHLRLKRW